MIATCNLMIANYSRVVYVYTNSSGQLVEMLDTQGGVCVSTRDGVNIGGGAKRCWTHRVEFV